MINIYIFLTVVRKPYALNLLSSTFSANSHKKVNKLNLCYNSTVNRMILDKSDYF
ncbi:hypothetical protein FHT21_004235 [Pedobacter sp. SG908]|nr:hypothetical protein [Pedobacter sp. SG908]NMN37958.1 hypothetical protein [Pedobacter sp. SG918]